MYGACAPVAALMEHYCIGWPRLFSWPRQVGQRYVQLRTQWPRLEPPGLLCTRATAFVQRRACARSRPPVRYDDVAATALLIAVSAGLRRSRARVRARVRALQVRRPVEGAGVRVAVFLGRVPVRTTHRLRIDIRPMAAGLGHARAVGACLGDGVAAP